MDTTFMLVAFGYVFMVFIATLAVMALEQSRREKAITTHQMSSEDIFKVRDLFVERMYPHEKATLKAVDFSTHLATIPFPFDFYADNQIHIRDGMQQVLKSIVEMSRIVEAREARTKTETEFRP